MRPVPTRPRTSPLIELRARQLRSWLTPSEQKLWAQLQGARLGIQFRRQVVIGRFIADFVAPAERLVVEIDGAYHARRRRADASRDRKLQRLGYRVLRLDPELVLRDVARAVEQVRAALREPP